MLDTIRLYVSIEHPQPLFERLDEVLAIETKERGVCGFGVPYIKGQIGNLKFKFNYNILSMEGSIPKFLNGENITPISREETKEAFVRLSRILGVDILNSAKITRLDLGACWSIKTPVREWLCEVDKYGTAGEKAIRNHSVTFIIPSSRSFILYDKITEAKKKKMMIPDLPTDQLLRAEMQIKRNAQNQLKVILHNNSTITPALICDPEGYDFLKQYLHNELKKITFKRSINPDFVASNFSGFTKWALVSLITTLGGIEGVRSWANTQHEMTSMNKTRIISGSKGVYTKPDVCKLPEIVAQFHELADSVLLLP